jgi:uncharacterized membrane protein YdjX (TVP38/TMEM64 family)
MDQPSGQKDKSLVELLRALTAKPPPRSVVIALIIALGISALSLVLMQAFDGAAKIRDWITGAGVWAPLVFVGLKAATYVIAPLSGTPVKLAGGALFGFWEGAAYGLIGDTLGASLNFWIARLFRDKAVTRFAGKKSLKQIDDLTEHVGGWKALLAARLVLSSLYDFISYAAGLSTLAFRQFFLVTVLAGIPSSLWAAYIGNAAATSQKFLYIMFLVSALGLIALLFSHKFHGKKE